MDFTKITRPTTTSLLISFMDIQGFLRIAQVQRDLIMLFELLNGWATIIIDEVERAGGRVVKFIGDACLIVFPGRDADKLTGSQGEDWFLFDSDLDRATDLKHEAFTNDLDFILS